MPDGNKDLKQQHAPHPAYTTHTDSPHEPDVHVIVEGNPTWVNYSIGISAALAGILSILGIIKFLKSRKNNKYAKSSKK